MIQESKEPETNDIEVGTGDGSCDPCDITAPVVRVSPGMTTRSFFLQIQNLLPDEAFIIVTDAEYNFIEAIDRTELVTDGIRRGILHPSRRVVRMRHGHSDIRVDIAKAKEESGSARPSLFAFIIQAGGRFMSKACHTCRKGNCGPFEDCVVLDNENFQECGNCFWTGQACNGASAF